MDQTGGCLACISCTGFKAVSKTGKFCSRCSHALAKHYEGEKPVVEEPPHRRPSAAATAARRDNEIKLFTDVDESSADQQIRVAKMTPPARRMSSNQNPLANRSPMARKIVDKDRTSPTPPSILVKPVDSSFPRKEKPAPLVTGMSLKERIALYSAECKTTSSDTPPLGPSPSNRGSLKSSKSFRLFASGPSSPPPAFTRSNSMASPGSNKQFSFESVSSPTASPKREKQAPENDSASAAPPAPPVVVITSPNISRASIKDRIVIYAEAASSVTPSPKTKMKVFESTAPMPELTAPEDVKSSDGGVSTEAAPSSIVEEGVSNGALNKDISEGAPAVSAVRTSANEELPADLAAANTPPAPIESPEKRLSVKDRAGQMTSMLATDPRFGLQDDTVEPADDAMIEESKLSHSHLERPVHQATRRRSSARKSVHEIVAEDLAENPELAVGTSSLASSLFPTVNSGEA